MTCIYSEVNVFAEKIVFPCPVPVIIIIEFQNKILECFSFFHYCLCFYNSVSLFLMVSVTSGKNRRKNEGFAGTGSQL